jgi:hypothetical protein
MAAPKTGEAQVSTAATTTNALGLFDILGLAQSEDVKIISLRTSRA